MDNYLEQKFGLVDINLVHHDSSVSGLPAYIEVHLGKWTEDKGKTVLDLGNYIYRKFGLSYQSCPEYRGKTHDLTVRWFMSWKDIAPIQEKICAFYGKKVLAKDHLPLEFQSISIQSSEDAQVAIWKKTGQLVIYRHKQSGSTIEFNVGKKPFIYLQCEIGPISDFEVLGML
jgi:hypothetical protein